MADVIAIVADGIATQVGMMTRQILLYSVIKKLSFDIKKQTE